MPSSDAQISMIRSAYAEARLDPRHTSYVEAHGTGTKAGDPIEASAIAAGLAKSRDASTPLIVGSVKTNIGHLESASGLAGLIKAILCLENAMIPPSINFLKQNEALKLGQRQLKVSVDKASRTFYLVLRRGRFRPIFNLSLHKAFVVPLSIVLATGVPMPTRFWMVMITEYRLLVSSTTQSELPACLVKSPGLL